MVPMAPRAERRAMPSPQGHKGIWAGAGASTGVRVARVTAAVPTKAGRAQHHGQAAGRPRAAKGSGAAAGARPRRQGGSGPQPGAAPSCRGGEMSRVGRARPPPPSLPALPAAISPL